MIIYDTHTVPTTTTTVKVELDYISFGVVLGAIVFVVPKFTVLT